MNKSIEQDNKHPSLENLIISENLGIETLHPGGLNITTELAELCNIAKGVKVLDVASGTGESIIHLVEKFNCIGKGIDNSNFMIERSKNKAIDRNINVEFVIGDIHNLPIEDNYFDIVISLACIHNLRIFDLDRALKEIERVGRHGYIMLESYRNEQEQFNLQCWALTCESFFDHKEWPWIFNHFGYTGDYEFIYFE